jgi:hypothetical protein
MTKTLIHITEYSEHARNEHHLAAHIPNVPYKNITTTGNNQRSYAKRKRKKPTHQKYNGLTTCEYNKSQCNMIIQKRTQNI